MACANDSVASGAAIGARPPARQPASQQARETALSVAHWPCPVLPCLALACPALLCPAVALFLPWPLSGPAASGLAWHGMAWRVARKSGTLASSLANHESSLYNKPATYLVYRLTNKSGAAVERASERRSREGSSLLMYIYTNTKVQYLPVTTCIYVCTYVCTTYIPT